MKVDGLLRALADLYPEKKPGIKRTGGSVGPRDLVEKKTILYPYRNSNPIPRSP
jgi:hypothetical protein